RGTPLIHWTASSMIAAGAQEIAILFNSRGQAAQDYLQGQGWPVRWTFLKADTGSSWESFRLVSRMLADKYERFLMSTVDALIPSEEIAGFAEFASKTLPSSEPAAALAVTRFVEDDKPLWADLDMKGQITAMGPACRQREFATCGLYALNRSLTQSMEK